MEHLFTLKFLKIAAISAIIFVILDILWIGFVASNMYSKKLGFLAQLKDGKVAFNLPVGLLVQVIISIGLSVVIYTFLQLSPSLHTAIFTGAFLGFVIYFTYDMTNYSFVNKWPLDVSIFDIIWGTFQGVLAGVYVYYISSYFS